jgi:hypothetical protein
LLAWLSGFYPGYLVDLAWLIGLADQPGLLGPVVGGPVIALSLQAFKSAGFQAWFPNPVFKFFGFTVFSYHYFS